METKIAIILGTRPEIIKLSPLIRYCQKRKILHFVLHTNQHNTYFMDKVFFRELGLTLPKYRLSAVGYTENSRSGFTGKIMPEIEKILLNERPKFVLVQGDTDSTLAGALVAAKLSGVILGHIEAGLRSYDRRMPEEINRIISDHMAECLFAPTKEAKDNLVKEGIPSSRIFVTGNTIVDALKENMKHISGKIGILRRLGLKPRSYGLLTLHRPENVDNKERLTSILMGIKMIYKRASMPLIFPAHPRTKKRIKKFGISLSEGIHKTRPLGFWDFLALEKHARVILTDSGGLQEEACILDVPCATLRDNTERSETITIGANVLTGSNSFNILNRTLKMLNKKNNWRQPFGTGDTSEKIINILFNRK